MIAIYYERDEVIAHLVNTLEDASKWLNVTRDALYKSLHLHGVMKVKGFIIERVELDCEDYEL